MPLIILLLAIYVLVSEWRSFEQKKKLVQYRETILKLEKDQTVWYDGVLPEADRECLFEENNNSFRIGRLTDKYWLKKDGSADFSKIKRWAYMRDIENL